MKIKIQKFVIIPVACEYDDVGELVNEKQLQPIVHFSCKYMDLNELKFRLEAQLNEPNKQNIKTTKAK